MSTSYIVIDDSLLLVRDDVYSRLYTRMQGTNRVFMLYGEQCLVGVTSLAREEIGFVTSRHTCLYVSREAM